MWKGLFVELVRQNDSIIRKDVMDVMWTTFWWLGVVAVPSRQYGLDLSKSLDRCFCSSCSLSTQLERTCHVAGIAFHDCVLHLSEGTRFCLVLHPVPFKSLKAPQVGSQERRTPLKSASAPSIQGSTRSAKQKTIRAGDESSSGLVAGGFVQTYSERPSSAAARSIRIRGRQKY